VQLQGKLAVVTGGGRGIGRGIVDRFRDEGAKVAVVQRRELDVVLAADENVVHVPTDLADPDEPSAAIERVVEIFGGIDVLVNNAGIMFERGVGEISLEEWDLMTAINLRAPLFLAQAAAPHMRERGGGSIINIGSIEGIGANPAHAAYCASKAGVHGLTRALAVDLGESGIRCNAIAPGWMESDLSETYFDSFPDPPAARAALERLHPLGRVGHPADVGDLAAFLAGDGSSFLTGEVIVLDGGRTARLPMP